LCQRDRAEALEKSEESGIVRRVFTTMATYIYETVPSKADEKPKRYEIKQSMKDAPLEKHPETGEKIRRVVSGGFGLMAKGGSGGGEMSGGHSCGSPGCCH
jgi:predicted nucleic acid-binding Zn ribbon protein